jgi:hypothetical protein
MWTLTAYFNPLRNARRLDNFRKFRSLLRVPLVTVELGFGDRYDLASTDSDILIQIPGECILWQKERLLNVALNAVPSSCEYVAWLDGDIILTTEDWADLAILALEEYSLVQLFDTFTEISHEEPEINVGTHPVTGVSAASILRRDGWTSSLEELRLAGLRPMFGLAWAARKALMLQHGFYDAMILGGGDRAMACAACGHFQHAIDFAHLDSRRTRHYMIWANSYFQSVSGRVGYIAGLLSHFWHGDASRRGYLKRHKDLSALDFDPARDIVIDNYGAWRWATQNFELHRLASDYFYGRDLGLTPGASPRNAGPTD